MTRHVLLLVCTLSLLLVSPAYAIESEDPANAPVAEAPASGDAASASDAVFPVLSLDTASRTFSVSSVDDVAPAAPDGAADTMDKVVVKILGEYQRKTMTVQELDTDGNVLATSTQYVPGLAGLDWEWIAGAAIFALFLLCLMRLIGGLLKL